jgi:hypothetical protein
MRAKRNVPLHCAFALLAFFCVGTRAVSAAECFPYCDFNHYYGPFDFTHVQPDLFGYPLCGPRGNCSPYLSPPLPAFTGGGSPCVFPGRPRYSRCHELLASLRRRQTMTSGERSTPALFAGKSDMEITDASSSVFSFHWRGGTAQCDAASIRAADIGIRPVHRWVRTPSVLLLWRDAAVPGDDVRAGRVCSKPWQFFA